MNCICSYSKFFCKIEFSEKEKHLIENFKNAYDLYYRFSQDESLFPSVAEIKLVYGKAENLCNDKLINCEPQLIHSSHSKNIKYLLTGAVHTQKNAEKYAKILVENQNNRIIFIQGSQSVIIINNSKIEIWGDNIFDDFIYVFETLLNTYMESIGGIALHAASCSIDKHGIVVCGKSGSGKTSLLFDLIEDRGAVFHSNDRVIIYKDKSIPCICGIPIPVNVPIKTMRKISHSVDPKIISCADDESKIRFKVNEITKLFTKFENDDLPLETVFITDYSSSEPSLQKLKTQEAIDDLEILSPLDECHPNWLGVFHPSYSDDQCRELLLDYLKNCGLYRVFGFTLITAIKDEV